LDVPELLADRAGWMFQKEVQSMMFYRRAVSYLGALGNLLSERFLVLFNFHPWAYLVDDPI
jgi:hypothetical protein